MTRNQVIAKLIMLPSNIQSWSSTAASLALTVDQSGISGATVVSAADGAVAFTDLAITRANSYPPDYPDRNAGAGGRFWIQFTVANVANGAVAGH